MNRRMNSAKQHGNSIALGRLNQLNQPVQRQNIHSCRRERDGKREDERLNWLVGNERAQRLLNFKMWRKYGSVSTVHMLLIFYSINSRQHRSDSFYLIYSIARLSASAHATRQTKPNPKKEHTHTHCLYPSASVSLSVSLSLIRWLASQCEKKRMLCRFHRVYIYIYSVCRSAHN